MLVSEIFLCNEYPELGDGEDDDVSEDEADISQQGKGPGCACTSGLGTRGERRLKRVKPKSGDLP